MGKIIPHITESFGNLAKYRDDILKVVARAEETVFPRLQIDWDIDVVFSEVQNFIIPEDGVGGRTYAGNFILVSIDVAKFDETLLYEMLCHELLHAARWGKNPEFMATLLDGAINEGLATYFEAEIARAADRQQFFIKTILERSDEENRQILDVLRPELNSERYDDYVIFYHGNADLPRWAGYSLGYFVVKEYLKQTGQRIEEVFAADYETLKKALPQ